MNLPNKITVLRMALVPVFLALFYIPIPNGYFWAMLVFIAASFTDMLDGKIARSRGLVTDFGKFMDPLADKILVVSAAVCLLDVRMVPALVVVVIISREFLVTSLRLVAAPRGIIIAADKWGKYKTAAQMVWIGTALLMLWLVSEELLPKSYYMACSGVYIALLVLVTVLTVASGANYVIKNRAVLSDM